MPDSDRPALLIVQENPPSPSETFLRAHAESLPARVAVVHGPIPSVAGRPLQSQSFAARVFRKALRVLRGQGWDAAMTSAYLVALRRYRPDVVLAEYGGTGVGVMDACRRVGVPFVVHFHGYDASIRAYLREMAPHYRRMFGQAAAVVAVSRAMREKLIALGAPADKVHWNPCGVDCAAFGGADPAAAGPTFLAVGRFTEKKAPQLTLRAFAEVHRRCPEARLRMIGFGPLLESCQALARELGVADAAAILGACPPAVVQAEMRQARCFVQHSVEAPDGDSEGTPVAVLEASASGLPVVATRHAGIPDVVREGETGLLVAEHDVAGMAERMLRLAQEPELAARLGRAGRDWIAAEFSMEKSIERLWAVIAGTLPGSSIVAPRESDEVRGAGQLTATPG